MKRCVVLVVVLATFLIGCVTAPVSRIDVSDLVGKWRGPMTVSRYHETGHQSTYRPSAELEIYNPGLRGKFTLLLSENESKSYSFRGRIEGDKLVAHWKGGNWIKLKLKERDGKLRLEGDYEFRSVGGLIVLHKTP